MTMPDSTTQRLGDLAPAGVTSPERWAADLIERMRRLGMVIVDEHDPEVIPRVAKALRDNHRCSEEPWGAAELAFHALEAL